MLRLENLAFVEAAVKGTSDGGNASEMVVSGVSNKPFGLLLLSVRVAPLIGGVTTGILLTGLAF